MTESCVVQVDGVPVAVPAGAIVLAALVAAGAMRTRRSVSGEPRFALCGIGQCQECRVNIDGRPQQLACRVRCKEGMRILSRELV